MTRREEREEAIYRSADMTYVQLYIPLEISREIVCLLGKLGVLMFRDLNKKVTEFQRNYVNELRKFNDMEESLEYLRDTIAKHGEIGTMNFNFSSMIITPTTSNRLKQHLMAHTSKEGKRASVGLTSFPGSGSSDSKSFYNSLETHNVNSIGELIDQIKSAEATIRRLNESLEDLQKKLNNLVETRYIIFKSARLLQVNPKIAGADTIPEYHSGSTSTRYTDEEQGLFEREEYSLNDLHFGDESMRDPFLADEELVGGDSSSQLDEISFRQGESVEDMSIYQMERGVRGKFMLIGSIQRTKVEPLCKILWRLLRGNLYFQNIPIEEPLLGEEESEKVEKDCIVILTHGENLLSKVKRVINSMNGMTIDVDMSNSETIKEINNQIDDLKRISATTEQALQAELLVVNDQISEWKAIIRREKYIYATLNLFRQESQGLVAEGWIPTSELTRLSNSLNDFIEDIGSEYSTVVTVILTNRSPPTFFRTNKFTKAFQAIVDAYGIATYKEVNPGLATIVTFPFMFAIMFGDTGHGIILFLVALFLIIRERKFLQMKRGEIFDMAFTGRYVLVLMGFFSIYTGLLYNDIFSKPMTFFKSGWRWPSSFKENEAITATQVGVYPFGIDYAWHGTTNSLIFTNSYKMKLSVIMGFVHMTYSLMFSLANYLHFHSRIDIIGNFIPSIIFMVSIFGYLTWAIIYKWCVDWIKEERPPPGLLNMLINMFLSPGTIDIPLYSGQHAVQKVLLILAVVCVPWLLLFKPLTLRKLHKSAKMRGYKGVGNMETDTNLLETELEHQNNPGNNLIVTEFDNRNIRRAEEGERPPENDNDGNNADNDDDSDMVSASEEFNFGDVMIHQVIHTIEFCLNCISHTASYLRLWALSLAHAQLSTVLWDMTIKNAFKVSKSVTFVDIIKVFFLFPVWFVLTVAILVLMEGVSAMLHALRLHWVEAMSKFFEGEGYEYAPFSFKNLEEEE